MRTAGCWCARTRRARVICVSDNTRAIPPANVIHARATRRRVARIRQTVVRFCVLSTRPSQTTHYRSGTVFPSIQWCMYNSSRRVLLYTFRYWHTVSMRNSRFLLRIQRPCIPARMRKRNSQRGWSMCRYFDTDARGTRVFLRCTAFM
jgi:hypothetical protein